MRLRWIGIRPGRAETYVLGQVKQPAGFFFYFFLSVSEAKVFMNLPGSWMIHGSICEAQAVQLYSVVPQTACNKADQAARWVKKADGSFFFFVIIKEAGFFMNQPGQ
jgi:hypothetical protein